MRTRRALCVPFGVELVRSMAGSLWLYDSYSSRDECFFRLKHGDVKEEHWAPVAVVRSLPSCALVLTTFDGAVAAAVSCTPSAGCCVLLRPLRLRVTSVCAFFPPPSCNAQPKEVAEKNAEFQLIAWSDHELLFLLRGNARGDGTHAVLCLLMHLRA